MPDQWNEKLRCSACGKTGTASLSQKGRALPIVNSVSESFKAVLTEFGPIFHCRACDVDNAN
jgi:hypothetical protein